MDGTIFGLLAFSFICAIGAIIGFKFDSANKGKKNNCDAIIEDVYRKVFSRSGGSVQEQLKELLDFGMEWQIKTLLQFEEDNEIHTTEDTESNLGMCGASNTHFYYGIDFNVCKYNTLMTMHTMFDEYAVASTILSRNRYADIEAWKQAFVRMDQIAPLVQASVKVFADMKTNQCVVTANNIELDRIKYYKIEGGEHYISNVQGGGVNLQGAVAGAIIGGGAAAIIGSQIGTETRTNIERLDNRKIIIFYDNNGVLDTFNVESKDIDETIAALRKLIPQKEESVARTIAQSAPATVPTLSSADELRKFKDLLDSGVISQEEFDAKKQQLLSLPASVSLPGSASHSEATHQINSLPKASSISRSSAAPSAPSCTPSSSFAIPANNNVEKWICPHCNTANSVNYGQCKKCGRFRGK